MTRLFWKLFLALWFSIMAFSMVTAWVNAELARQSIPDPPEIAWSRSIDKAEQLLGKALLEGPMVVRERLNALPRPIRNSVYLFDEQGRELLGRERMRRHMQRGRMQYQERALSSADGEQWRLVVLRRSPPPQFLEPGSRGIALRLLLAGVLSAVLSWILARYLTRPLEALGRASRRLASGDLSARIGSPLTERRDEFGTLTRELNRMAVNLEATQRAGRRLLRDVSHELRSPLARQRVALELARTRSEGRAALELDRIEQESERLEVLVDEVLELLRETAAVRPDEEERFDLNALAQDLVEVVAYELPEDHGGIDVDVEHGLEIRGDRSLLWRALENLLRNAITHAGGDQPITLRASAPKESEVRIEVLDGGEGLPSDALDKVFDPFYRIDESRQGGQGGHGLGLAIAAAAVRRHGGSIRAAQRPGGGLAMIIELPVGTAVDG